SDVLEATVVVKNPCKFPVEFYSVDFDEQYLEEEKMLRATLGPNYPKCFWMPACALGGTVPREVLEDYKALKLEEELKAVDEAEAEAKAETTDEAAPACEEVKDTEDPLYRAIRRRMGVNPEAERLKAQQPRGIVVIVHGAPRAGKSQIAAALCYYYDADYVSIDTVVKEAIADD
ncbi:HYDIN protein, partial [Rhipidura dahli]|nr:HYDIN protein [Rhipidura dahli]